MTYRQDQREALNDKIEGFLWWCFDRPYYEQFPYLIDLTAKFQANMDRFIWMGDGSSK